jgi:two-component system, cell cycle sensor histidine kinase and response regulator CckA
MTTPIRILLVEDSEGDAKLLVHALRRANLAIEIERVQDGAALREALAAKRCDAVICDWSLPGLDALGALEIFRASGIDVPFIVVSGTVGEELAVTAMRSGAHDYVLKDKLARLPAALERELRESRMRDEHRRQERRFRALIEKSSEAVLLTDIEGRIVYASSAATTIFGVPAERLIGRNSREFIHPDDLQYATEIAARVRHELVNGAHNPIRLVQPDGTIRWVEYSTTNLLDDPAVGAVVSNLRDITERRLAADALRVSESRFARLAESGVIGVLTADVHGNILASNRAFADMVGYTQQELACGEIKWGDLIPPDLGESIRQTTADLVIQGAAAPFESAVIRKDGVRVPMLCGVTMLEYPVCIAFSIDLTERMQAEHALRSTEDQLRQAQKMEAVGRLAGGIAHDFNNVLSVILSYAEMLHDDLAVGDPRRDDAGEILGAAKRATGLTRQLLMFSRQQVLEPKVLDLNELLGNMDKMIQRVLGEDVELVTRRAETLGHVKADPSSIEQVMMNLVVNARDAMPTGGTLTLETSDVFLDNEHVRLHLATRAGPHVMITVTDTGTGMDATTRARIFEPFFTTKPKDKGTGLGLSTVFGIVHQAGGGIEVESEVGRGTTFKVYVPQVDDEVTLERATSVRVGRGTETILLVEDEAQVRTVARNILQRHGYCVIEAASPEDAIALCAHDGVIDLLLTDVVMPHMSGPELANRIVQLRPTTRVLFMSGYTDDAVVRHGVLTSQIALLQKPLSPTSLADKVREVLDKRPDSVVS